MPLHDFRLFVLSKSIVPLYQLYIHQCGLEEKAGQRYKLSKKKTTFRNNVMVSS